MSSSFFDSYKSELIQEYHELQQYAERPLARVNDVAFFTRLPGRDEPSNSIAMLVKHISGNLRSRWTDFLTTDGDKPDRFREREFMAEPGEDRTRIMQRWDLGWQILFATLDTLQDEDFLRTVTIGGEPVAVLRTVHHSLTHLAQHIGQIDLLASLLQVHSE